MLRALSEEHEFVVFAVQFDNPDPARIEWVRIPVPTRPLALLFVIYHLVAPAIYALYRIRKGVRFDLVQMVESNLSFGDLSYSHFCHAAYLRNHWRTTRGSGLRGFLRWIDHRFHAALEPRIYSRVRQIVVPSRGLGRELKQEFPFAAEKIDVLPNAVDVERLERPLSFDRDRFRRDLGLDPGDIVFLFVALGQFERKGLPLLLEALSRIRSDGAKLLIVGGEPDLVASYQARARQYGLEDNVIFAGMQRDVRSYFWSADAFAFPSAYETFSLVTYEAAAAGLPLIAPRLNGIDELIRDGENGIVISRTVEGLEGALRAFVAMKPGARKEMGRRARAEAIGYNDTRFSARWTELYRNWNVHAEQHVSP
jgi:glycosyltransferase involved in cell wall biosynthesis